MLRRNLRVASQRKQPWRQIPHHAKLRVARRGSASGLSKIMSDKAVITCALNGVLTDPKQHHVPVTPAEMAREAKAAFNAGASVMHIHLRQQAPGKGHLPSWEVGGSRDIRQASREPCPGEIINHTTRTEGLNYQG